MHVEKNGTQIMNLQVTQGLSVTILTDSAHEFLMPTKQVASGYDVSPKTISGHIQRNQKDFIEGKHFVKGSCISSTLLKNVQPHQVFFTKRGIVRLGFFIKSERARLFRDWAEDLILQQSEQRSPNQQVKRLQERFIESPEYEQARELIDSAITAVGSSARLAERIGIHQSVLTHIRKRPWLVSADRLRGIELACRNLISRDSKVDTEAIEQLMQIQDAELRMSLFTKMRQGGLI